MLKLREEVGSVGESVSNTSWGRIQDKPQLGVSGGNISTQLSGVKVDRMDSHRNDSHIEQKLFILHKWSAPLFIVI